MDPLRNFPGGAVPSTWSLNERFLKIIEEQDKRWQDAGYQCQFGLEIDFNLMPFIFDPEDKEDRERLADLCDGNPFLSGKKPAADFSSIKQNLKDTLSSIFEDIDSGTIELETLARDTNWDEGEMRRELERYGQDLESEDEKLRDQAAKNIFMARLHLYNADQGGIRDVIEPRFGDAIWGLGWWDAEDDGEVRLPYGPDPLRLIHDYHLVIDKLIVLGNEMGVVPYFSNAVHPQLHFSMVRLSDGKNMMCTDDKDSADFCESMANGLVRATQEAPAIFQEYDSYNNDRIFTAQFGTTRSDQIRQRKTDWEFRLYVWGMFGHLAREIALVMGSTANGVLNPETYDEWSQKYLTSVKAHDALILSHRFGNPVSALQATFSHCKIGEDGYLMPPSQSVLEYNTGRMVDEIGADNIKRFKSQDDKEWGVGQNLDHADGWKGLIKVIRITEDNEFDFSGLDPEIAAALDVLKIEGRRKIYSGNAYTGATYKSRLQESLEFIDSSPSLKAFMGDDDLSAIKDVCVGNFEAARQEEARDFVDDLSRSFNNLAARYEDTGPDADPIEMEAEVLMGRYFYARFLQDCIEEETVREFEQLDRVDWDVPDDDDEVINRTKQTGHTRMSQLVPYFRQALENKAKTLSSSGGSNWEINVIHDAASFMDKSLRDICTFDLDYFDRMIESIMHVTSEGKAGRMQFELLKLASSTFVSGFFSLLIRDPDVKLEDIKTSFEDSRKRVQNLFEMKYMEYEQALKEAAKHVPPRDGFKTLLHEVEDLVMSNYDHDMGLLDRMEEKEGDKPEPAQPPWKYDFA